MLYVYKIMFDCHPSMYLDVYPSSLAIGQISSETGSFRNNL